MLQDYQLDEDVKKALTVTFCVNTAINEGVNEIVDRNEENKEIINVEEFFDEFSRTNNPFSTPSQQIISVPIGDREGEIDKTGKLLEKLFKKAYENNDVVKEIMKAKAHGLQKLLTALTKKSIVLSMTDLKIGKNRRLYVKNRIYVPENELLQLFLLQHHGLKTKLLQPATNSK